MNPVTKSKQSSSAICRAGSNTQSARHKSSSGDGRAGSNARPARPSAKLDRTHDQLGHPPSWTSPVQLGGWPSWIERSGSNARSFQLNHLPSWTSPVRRMAELEGSRCFRPAGKTSLLGLYRTRYCFVSIGGTVGTLRFRNRKNSFSRITFGLIV
ncbi:hypothetical protein DY000_02053610 [Brassica cretica]|uniref:Uncharacterized protein n=1 Tax=Brassica cretica TaxID=69181 RepID=A0ABQ7AG00_BRACR|nr:hypothetical protein DY000_02053610 [Brassica cretica]